jgi:hypothetical protein
MRTEIGWNRNMPAGGAIAVHGHGNPNTESGTSLCRACPNRVHVPARRLVTTNVTWRYPSAALKQMQVIHTAPD